MPADPLGHQVDAPAVGLVHGLERVVLREAPLLAGGNGCGPPGRSRSPPSASSASRRLRRRAGGGETPEPAFPGSFDCGAAPPTLASGTSATADQPVQRLDRPAVATNRRASQSSSSGWRRLAARAEVAGRGDDPPAEVVLPDAVDHDAGRQRVVRVGRASRRAPAGRSPPLGWRSLPPRTARNRRGTGPQLLGVAPALDLALAGRSDSAMARPGGAWPHASPPPRGTKSLGRFAPRRRGRGNACSRRCRRGRSSPRRDRVELVVVAAGAADRQAEERLAQRVDRVLDRQVAVVLRVEPKRRAMARKPVAMIRASRRAGPRPRSGRRRAARGGTGRKACRR